MRWWAWWNLSRLLVAPGAGGRRYIELAQLLLELHPRFMSRPSVGCHRFSPKLKTKRWAMQPMWKHIVDVGPDKETQEDVACGVAACRPNIYWYLSTIHVPFLSVLYFLGCSQKNAPFSFGDRQNRKSNICWASRVCAAAKQDQCGMASRPYWSLGNIGNILNIE